MKYIVGFLQVVFLCLIIYILFFVVKIKFFRDFELKSIEKKLSNIENVDVVNIWGHDDITIEEISARVRLKDKGEIVLCNLSDDVKNYPEDVYILEIDGFSFDIFYDKNGSGTTYLNLGTYSDFYERFGIKFFNEKDVIDNYDLIVTYLNTLKHLPNVNHFKDELNREEHFVLVKNSKQRDIDPIYNLLNLDEKIEIAKRLNWQYEK